MNSRDTQERWILTFDVACGKCRAVSAAVAEAGNGKLEVLPLTDPDVQAWRRRSLGPAPKWVPTLLRVRRDAVRAWTGPTMALALARHLGPRTTTRVLRALGRLEQDAAGESTPESDAGLGRKHFLRLLGGTATAIGLIATAQTPALAQSAHVRASAWVEANMADLPRDYAEIARHPLPYRKAIHRVLTPRERSRVWADHLRWYRAGHPDLTPAQNRIVDDAFAVVTTGLASGTAPREELHALGRSAREAFGPDEAAALLSTLGPVPAQASTAAACTCSTVDPYCSWLFDCGTRIRCTRVPNDCGTLWNEDCNGTCY
ncbi:bacteriocin fulvocin C-related protein [Streptomyces sp. SID3343]|uniref:bacteriocin fulvocin C-related protein n=1 Tax=Streptomyces sp. SID3343 TaxID=2690260 RepID=UPI0013714653|nr:bacteriocin fulvocin C-related protein [Streptomyces sp. SID3343]MYW00085.1 bacteriocin fulvocin C-related protein [Streptomyces sp. SID3343]